MNELITLINLFKGDLTTAQLIAGADVSRETFRKIERGIGVKLTTVKAISDFLKLPPKDWMKLVRAWIKIQIGTENAKRLTIYLPEDLRKYSPATNQVQTLLDSLPQAERTQLLLAISRPEIRRTLPALNSLYDSLRKITVARG